jgi:hypothetical protein
MDLKPTLEELLDVFFNKEEVEKIVRLPVNLINLVYLI